MVPGERHSVVTEGSDRAGLRASVERVLTEALGRPIPVTGIQIEPCPFATLFPIEVVSASLGDEGNIRLLLKHLGTEQADHPEKQRRDREIRVYENLLGEEGLPVVRYYGSTWNETTRRWEVFLEYVDDWNLKYQKMEHWFTAARRLARFHAHFAGLSEQLRESDFLLRLDADYLHYWAVRARNVVEERSAPLARELAPVVEGYDRVMERLGRQPVTLVHNDLSPKNVIAVRSTSPARICMVDWEMAGAGCGLLDLVHLKYGLDPANDEAMCRAYVQELEGTGLLPADPAERGSLLAACELHKTLYRLAFANAWGLPDDRVAEWVADARTFFSQV